MRKPRNLQLKDSLIIVCEGTDTEYQYFEEVADRVRQTQPWRYSNIKVVPSSAENLAMIKIRHVLNQGARKMKQGASNPQWLYYVKEDDSQNEYDKYKEDPVRFVREAQLFMLEDGYSEAWAVYDKDVHTGHEKARGLSDSSGVRIAFSSYSFEEWVLCHFERVSMAFVGSLCASKDCGVNHQGCRGNKCLIGRIREKGYIPGFKKNMTSLFSHYLQNRLNRACFNAAWLRHLDYEPKIWERNPYTDVDRLMMHLLGNGDFYEWIPLNKEFLFEGVKLVVATEGDSLRFTIKGNGQILMTGKRLTYCDETGTPVKMIFQNSVLINDLKPSCSVLLDKGMRFVRLEEDVRFKIKKVYVVELPFFC